MHDIPNKKKEHKPRYEGLHPKIIHLHPKTFEVLNTVAKGKNLSLKKYIEYLCLKQAQYEAHLFMKKYEENLQKHKNK